MKIYYILILCSLLSKNYAQNRWLNSNNICDSIIIESISETDFIFEHNNYKIPATREKNKYTLQIENNKVIALSKGDSLLFYNGNEYFRELKEKIGNLKQNWKPVDCNFPEEYLGSYNFVDDKFLISDGPFELVLYIQKIDDSNFKLFFDYVEGSISFNNYSIYLEKNVDKNIQVGSIKFISNKVIELTWNGMYDKKENKNVVLIPYFDNNNTTAITLFASSL